MLSLKKGQEVAQIVHKNSKAKPTIIYINDGDEEDNHIDSRIRDELLPKSFYTELRNVSPSNMLLLKKAIRESRQELLRDNNNLLDAYNRAQDLLKELLRKYIEIPKSEGHIQTLPTGDWPPHHAVMGPSGVGKSTYIGQYLKEYKKKFPKNNIYIFSPLKDDKAFDGLKAKYVKIDNTILEDPLDVSEFSDSVLVFDDIESIKDKQLNDAIQRFRDQVLETGRHYNETAVCVSHVILNGNQTKRILNECDRATVFPRSNFSAVSNLCRRYYGFEKDILNWMKNVPSRHITVKRSYPTTLITENAVKIL
jgi:hypothetical protein